MVLDEDIEGIIAASCFLFVFLAIGTICLAIRCQRRMERKKRMLILKNALIGTLRKTHDKVSVNAHTHSALSISEISSDNPTKMGGYRPKILAIEDGSAAGVSRDSLKEKEYKKFKYSKRTGSSVESKERYRRTPHISDNAAVSVVHVNGKVSQNGWIRDTQPKKQVIEGLVTISNVNNTSQRNSGEVIQGRVHQSSDYVNTSYRGQQSGELVRGHHVTGSGGELVRGHIIKQNVTVGEDGKLAVTSSEQRDLGEVVRGHMSRQHQESSTVFTPGGGEIVRGHIIKQTVEHGDDGNLVVTRSEQRDLDSEHGPYSITSPQIVLGQRETGHSGFSSQITQRQLGLGAGDTSYISSQQDGPQIVHGHYSSGREDSFHVTRQERRDVHGLLITEDHVTEGWENADDAAADALEGNDAVPDIVISDHEDGNVAKRHESISDFYNDRNKLKVIKKHSAHKPPDWLVQTYAEEASSVDIPRERSDSATQVDYAALETEEYYRRNASQKVTFNEVSTEIQDAEIIDHDDDDDDDDDSVVMRSGEIVSTITQRDAHYPDGGYGTYTVTDYVDPERQGRMVTQTYRNSQQSDAGASSSWMSTTSTTATSMRRMRQEVNESAERLPPAFTSTPRIPWDQQSETTFMVMGQDVDRRRQRGSHSDDDIPLPPL